MRLPRDDERHAIYGMTGMGKTVFALWCLSNRSYHRMPWIILDSKRDTTIAKIPRLTEIDLNDRIPKYPGVYAVRPMPSDVESGLVTDWLYKLWEAENTGLMIDEGYSLKRLDPALTAVLTQGRSKRIPVIALSQRPSWISPFIHSESEFKSVFFLQTPADIERVKDWLPNKKSINPALLPKAHSYWYCMPDRDFSLLGPCPPESEIMGVFDERKIRRPWHHHFWG